MAASLASQPLLVCHARLLCGPLPCHMVLLTCMPTAPMLPCSEEEGEGHEDFDPQQLREHEEFTKAGGAGSGGGAAGMMLGCCTAAAAASCCCVRAG